MSKTTATIDALRNGLCSNLEISGTTQDMSSKIDYTYAEIASLDVAEARVCVAPTIPEED